MELAPEWKTNAFAKIAAGIVRFTDFCAAFEKQVVIGCTSDTQMKAVNQILSKFSQRKSQKNTSICLIKNNDHELNLDLAAVDCTIVVGNAFLNTTAQTLIETMLKKQVVPVIELSNSAIQHDHGFVLQVADVQVEKMKPVVGDCFTELVSNYCDHVNGKTLRARVQQFRAQKQSNQTMAAV